MIDLRVQWARFSFEALVAPTDVQATGTPAIRNPTSLRAIVVPSACLYAGQRLRSGATALEKRRL